jgi:ribosomal protein L20A (L18A)
MDTFHVARFNMALAMFEMSGNAKSNEEKMKYRSLAKKYIESTYRVYPDLGGDAQTKRYDILLRKVQQVLKEPTVGLKAFDRKTASAAK